MVGPVERFVILSDVHANSCALAAVFARIKELEVDKGCKFQILVNGDFLDAGPYPLQTAQMLLEKSTVFIWGNHEEYLWDCCRHPLNQRYHDSLWRFVPWTVEKLGAPLLEKFFHSSVFSWQSESGIVNLVHASRESNSKMPEFFGTQIPSQNQVPNAQVFECDKVFFAGHSHYLGIHWEPGHRHLWVNTGSVGYAFVRKPPDHQNSPAATFVWLEVSKEPRQKAKVSMHCECVFYSRRQLLLDYLQSGALFECAPYSIAILAQSLFNEDIVFPFFQNSRKQGIPQVRLARALAEFLTSEKIIQRLREACREEQLEFSGVILAFNSFT